MDKQIYTTTDYDKFSKISNRQVVENKKLERELLEIGQRSPIIVNKKLQVIDGQHRLMYLKKHGKPVNYIIDADADFKTVISMNTSAVNWSLRDYIDAYAYEGDPEFVKLHKFIEKNTLLSDKMIVTAGASRRDGTASKVISRLREGEYVFSNEKQLVDFCNFYETLLSKTNLPNKPFLQSTLWTLFTTSVFDKTRMINQLKKYNLKNEDIEGYSKKNILMRFLEIYNGRWSDEHPNCIQYYTNRKGTLVIPSLPKQN